MPRRISKRHGGRVKPGRRGPDLLAKFDICVPGLFKSGSLSSVLSFCIAPGSIPGGRNPSARSSYPPGDLRPLPSTWQGRAGHPRLPIPRPSPWLLPPDPSPPPGHPQPSRSPRPIAVEPVGRRRLISPSPRTPPLSLPQGPPGAPVTGAYPVVPRSCPPYA